MNEICEVVTMPCGLLSKYLSMVTPGIGVSSVLEVVRCVKMDFDFDEKRITLTTTNLEMRTTVTVQDDKIKFPEYDDRTGVLSAAIYPDVLRNTMKFGRGNEIKISISDDARRIKTACGSMVNEYGLPNVKDFPGEIEQNGDAAYFSCMKGEELIAKLRAAASIIDITYTNKIMRGVYFHSNERELRFVGIKNGTTMLYDAMPSDAMMEEFNGMVIPKESALSIASMFGDYKGELELALGANFGVIKGGSLATVFRGIVGFYPNYRHLMPADFTADWKVSMKEFQQLTESIASANREMIHYVVENGICEAESTRGAVRAKNQINVKDGTEFI